MFIAIFEFDINLLLESVIYVSCMFVHVHALGKRRDPSRVVAYVYTDITGYGDN